MRINNGYLMLGVGACFLLASLTIDKFVTFNLLDMFHFGELVRMLGVGFIGSYLGYKTGFKDGLKNKSKKGKSKSRNNKKDKKPQIDSFKSDADTFSKV